MDSQKNKQVSNNNKKQVPLFKKKFEKIIKTSLWFIEIYTLTLFSSLQFHPHQNFQTHDNVNEIEKIHKCLHKHFTLFHSCSSSATLIFFQSLI